MPARYNDCPRILREFLSYHETIKGQSEKTVAEYYLDLRMFLRFIVLIRSGLPYETDLNEISIKDVDLEFIRKIDTIEIYDYLSYLSQFRVYHPETHNPGQGISNTARARKLSSMKAFFKYLTVRTKQLEQNPAADIEYPRLRQALPKYLTVEQTFELLDSVEGTHADRDLAILMVFLNCGIRISELSGLNYGDIYKDRLRVLGKGNKERTVYLAENCLDAIMQYNNALPEHLRDDPKRPLFLSQKGGRMSTSAIHRLVKKHLAAAGLDATQFSAHKLRHTAATMMLSQGVDVKTVQEVLGHENLNTTQIYTHIENTELKMAAEASPLSKFHPKTDNSTE